MRVLLLTCLAMVFFAANSVLGRLALSAEDAGPAAFAMIRLLSGALSLAVLLGLRDGRLRAVLYGGSWKGAAALFCYVFPFTLAYIGMPSGLGALVLFLFVQITMVGAGLRSGERLSLLQIAGFMLAVVGLVWLLLPRWQAGVPLVAAMCMAVAGISWGVYSLQGRFGGDPTIATAGNFIRAALLSVLIAGPYFLLTREAVPMTNGIILALISGGITSGFGYAVWYAALPKLTAIKAGLAQLSVPPLAAIGGVLLVDEPLTFPFIGGTFVVLAGIGIATLSPRKGR